MLHRRRAPAIDGDAQAHVFFCRERTTIFQHSEQLVIFPRFKTINDGTQNVR